MMGLKGLASILWLSHCLLVVFAVPRHFTGSGYLVYDINTNPKNKPINSDVDELSVEFKTVQPSGLLFHAGSTGNKYADYVTLEIVGGRIRYGVRYGRRANEDDAHAVFLGKNLDDGKPHTVKVNHNKRVTTIVLDGGSAKEREERVINTDYEKLEVDTAIYVGGAQNLNLLLSVESNAYFMGCLTYVNFKPEQQSTINFLDKDVAVTYPSSMNNECTAEEYAPFTFSEMDSSFVCPVKGLAAANKMDGTFMFRTYNSAGTLLKQSNGANAFEISYKERYIELKVTYANSDYMASISYSHDGPTSMNNGNWHPVTFSISAASFKLTVGSNTDSRSSPSFPNDFFKGDVTAGGFMGCMRDLKINNEECNPNKDSNIKNVEWDRCNITDFCVFSPCLNGGTCSQTGKSFKCACSGTGYNTLPVCQFSNYKSTCEILNREENVKQSNNYTLDFDGPGPIKPAKVYCNMTADPPTTRVLTRDIGIRLVPSDVPETPNSQRIRYIPSLAAAKALARQSGRCTQYLEFGCKQAKLLNVGGERLGFWVSADGVYQDYWGGAQPNSKSCACGETNTCLDKNFKCNCDAARNVWTADGGHLNSTTLLPVEEVMFKGVVKPGEANYTVGSLYCSGNISNSATFVNEDGFIKLKKWSPPSHGVISLYFRTPYAKGTILYNGDDSKEYFRLMIFNETTVRLVYDIGNGGTTVDLSLKNKKVNDTAWHKVVIFRNMKEFGMELDEEKGVNNNPLFLKRDLDLEDKDELWVGSYQFNVAEGFVGCIRGLTINGEVQDLRKLANDADYVQSECGAACKQNACKQGGKCLDYYNVYYCDCSKTPFYGYFCEQDKGASFSEKDSQLIYTYPTAESVPNLDIVVGFKLAKGKPCMGDIIHITSRDTEQFFKLSLDSAEKLVFSYRGQGVGSVDIKPLQGQSFCENRHTFALSRRGKKLNYTIDGVRGPSQETNRLDGLFSRMEKVIVGLKGDKGFKGCITGAKVTSSFFEGKNPNTVELIKSPLYDGKTKGFEFTSVSKEKCGPEPSVPEIPTPRPVGQSGGITSPPPSTPNSGKRADDDNKTAIIVVVVLILVLLLVVLAIVIYWYWARHKGEYHTHEDDEELKGTDPYIDLTAPRKPPAAEETEKKKEWYI